MPKIGGERGSVQNPLIRYAKEAGWSYVTPEEALALREGASGLIFRDVFRDRLLYFNKGFLKKGRVDAVIKRLERLPSNVNGNLLAWEFLGGLSTVFVEKEKRERNLDFLGVKGNVFQVTDEFVYSNGSKTVRFDVVFLVNGFPVYFVETKAAHKMEGIPEALDQVRRYHREAPEACALFQVYALTHLIRFFYGATWSLSMKSLYNWKEESGVGSFEDLVKTFFDPGRTLMLLKDYVLFVKQDDELSKVVLRPHQMRAVQRIVERAADKRKKTGLIWHTQGSGKTYTMIVAAKKIMENPLFGNPTVLMLVDRNELETQLFGNLVALEFGDVEVALSKRHLKQILSSGKKGLIVSMIHKFEDMPADINKSENIFVLVDEAHRTTTGDLGNYLMGALPNATFIGFTGTPIDKITYGRGTFKVFGKDDAPKGYLDKYGIAESIKDGTTVKLYYTLAENDLLPEKKVLEEEFLNLAEAEGISDIQALNRVLDRAVNLKEMLKNRERMAKIAKYVADYFKEYIEPMGYKAFLVGVDREACALYKKELDKHLPGEYSCVVYSPAHNDSAELTRHYLSPAEEKRVRKAFRKPGEMPRILIVTEKLLTGFDAPLLYCMYLDKPMRDHVLLQAIARVNRPYEDAEGKRKSAGFVLDFVGIFDNLEKALAFDSSDVKDISAVVRDIEVLKSRFIELVNEANDKYLPIIKGKKKDKVIEALLEAFQYEKRRHEFYKFFGEFSDIYEIISPDAFLRPYIDTYANLTRMYKIVKGNYDSGPLIDREFTRKTAKLLKEHVGGGEIDSNLEIYEIDEKTLEKLEDESLSDIERVFNLIRSISSAVEKDGNLRPYLRSIGEKAEIISLLYKERQKDTKDALEELKNLIKEINEAEKERAAKAMSPVEFSVYWILRGEKTSGLEEITGRINKVLEEYPYWMNSMEQEREVKKRLIAILRKTMTVKKSVELVNKIMKLLRNR
ncbi:MAG: type I restriction endonuclease subunit R [Candidatus Altiarchaeota archaeon]|nr:type I restriction endonuclease subunit R [Candidatus Altiarchaeota archaeon]